MADTSEVPKRKANFCSVCNVTCSSAFQLCEHVVGSKHAKRAGSDSLLQLSRLQYFFDKFMKLEPLVGLEYVEELQMTSGFQYKCLLCSFHGDRKPAFLHITGTEHIAKYLERRHPALLLPQAHLQKVAYSRAVHNMAAKVCKTYGRKRIKEVNVDCEEPKEAEQGSAERKTSEPHSRSVRYPERTEDEGRRRSPGFRGNGDFLDYLHKFQIHNDEDARIVQRITENCTHALVRFRKEQARQSKTGEGRSGGPPAPASVAEKTSNVVNCTQGPVSFQKEQAQQSETGEEGSGGPPAPATVTEKGSNVGNCGAGKVAVPPADATEIFFSSIKNMEESEVVSILHKIAATNPAFRSIDIPNAIRYLQATGRLKTS